MRVHSARGKFIFRGNCALFRTIAEPRIMRLFVEEVTALCAGCALSSVGTNFSLSSKFGGF